MRLEARNGYKFFRAYGLIIELDRFLKKRTVGGFFGGFFFLKKVKYIRINISKQGYTGFFFFLDGKWRGERRI